MLDTRSKGPQKAPEAVEGSSTLKLPSKSTEPTADEVEAEQQRQLLEALYQASTGAYARHNNPIRQNERLQNIQKSQDQDREATLRERRRRAILVGDPGGGEIG